MAHDEHYDALETRDPEARAAEQIAALRAQIAHAKEKTDFFGALLADVVSEQAVGKRRATNVRGR